jgi:glyoxylase-like metal-dependent hydrolase (beta-lactamase superfamily II)
MSARPAETAAAVRTAVIITHSHPDQTSAALREAVAAAERASCELVAPSERAAAL